MGAAIALVREHRQDYGKSADEGEPRPQRDATPGPSLVPAVDESRVSTAEESRVPAAGTSPPPVDEVRVPPVDTSPVPPAGQPLDPARAHRALVGLAARRAADDVAMLEPLLVAHEGRIHEALGLGSFHEYCSRLFGWCGRTTRERLRVAKAMRDLPAMRARWAAGELTYSVVRELTRVATPAVEADWLTWATAGGARLVAGGEREGALHAPTVLADVAPGMRVSCDEVFGPVVGVTETTDIDSAIALANDTNYGLSAAIFTRDIDTAMKFVRDCEAGNLHVNWGTQWRADMMPYGGVKDSGMGKEGPKYAVEEMTETKMVVFH